MDRIACGHGRDVARLDRIDVIVDASAEDRDGSCERVGGRSAAGRCALASARAGLGVRLD